MEIKRAILEKGIYSTDINISVAEWKNILRDTRLMKKTYKMLLDYFIAEPNHGATCQRISEKHPISSQFVNDIISDFGKAVQKKLKRFNVIGTNNEPAYWLIPMYGKHDGELFKWFVRPELIEALDNLDVDEEEVTQDSVRPGIEDVAVEDVPLTSEKQPSNSVHYYSDKGQSIDESEPEQLKNEPKNQKSAYDEKITHVDITYHQPETANSSANEKLEEDKEDVPSKEGKKGFIPSGVPSLLQNIYDHALEEVSKVFYKWYPNYKKQVSKYCQQLLMRKGNEDNMVTIAGLLNGDVLNGSIIEEQLYILEADDLLKILENWREIQEDISTIVRSNDINFNQYEHLQAFFTAKLDIKSYPNIINSVLASILPGQVTTMVDNHCFKRVILELHSRCPNYPAIQGDWFLDNRNFIHYCRNNVLFNEPWHISLFIWYIKSYFEEEAKRNKEIHCNRQRQKYIDLLIKHKNLIITGVTGTGKTNLAKAIAMELNAETAYIPLFPGGEDFAETPRLDGYINKDNPWKEVAFQSLCKKAAINFIDSHKPLSEQQSEETLLASFISFIDEIKDVILKRKKFPLFNFRNQSFASIVDINRDDFTTMTLEGDLIKLPIDTIWAKLQDYSSEEDPIIVFTDIVEQLSTVSYQDYYLSFMKAFDSYLQENKKKDFPKKAIQEKKFVAILDEVDASNLFNVFHESAYAIASHLRGEKRKIRVEPVDLINKNNPFQNGFYVPDNVYIIVIIDALKDVLHPLPLSLSKQFVWNTVKVEDSLMMWNEKIDEYKVEALKRLDAINKRINTIRGLGERYNIGPAYFLKIKEYDGDFDAFWNSYLREILRKLFGNLPNAVEVLEELKSAYQCLPKQLASKNVKDKGAYPSVGCVII